MALVEDDAQPFLRRLECSVAKPYGRPLSCTCAANHFNFKLRMNITRHIPRYLVLIYSNWHRSAMETTDIHVFHSSHFECHFYAQHTALAVSYYA